MYSIVIFSTAEWMKANHPQGVHGFRDVDPETGVDNVR